MSNTLYHYTDYSAFDGILNNKELRVNNVLNMNDAEEMHFFMEKLCAAVKERLRETGRADRISFAQNMFDEVFKYEFFYSAYAACFSAFRDDASQWERYGNFGRGVCIGMDEECLKRMCSGVLKLEKVFYQERMNNHPLVDNFVKLTLQGKSMEKKELYNQVKLAWSASVAYKHPSFVCENEVRLIVLPFTQDYFEIKPRYHVSTERIKKYYPIDLDRACRNAGCTLDELVSEIIIGPQSTQSRFILQDYLNDLGYDTLADKVVLSECPLRSVLK